MKAHVQYTREMHENFGYFATWAPNVQLQLGDIGVLRDYVFEPVTTLGRMGIPFQARTAGNAIDLDYASAGTTNIRVKLSGNVPPVGSLLAPTDVGVAIDFGAENAVIFQAANCQETLVEATD